MRVFAISDLHLSTVCDKPMDIFGNGWDNYLEKIISDWNEKVNDDDLVLIAGDISWAMNLQQAQPDLELIGKQKGKKVILKGNHDFWWSSLNKVKSILPKNMFLVQNNAIRFENYLITGTRGWLNDENMQLTEEDKKIYDREVLRLELALKDMQRQRVDGDKVIAMMHYPPFTAQFEPTRFTSLISDYNIDAVVYGHLHGKACRANSLVKVLDTNYYLTSCDLVGHKLVEIIL